MAKAKQAWEDHPNFRKTGANGQFKKEHVPGFGSTEFASVTPPGSTEDPHRDADRAGVLLPFIQLGTPDGETVNAKMGFVDRTIGTRVDALRGTPVDQIRQIDLEFTEYLTS